MRDAILVGRNNGVGVPMDEGRAGFAQGARAGRPRTLPRPAPSGSWLVGDGANAIEWPIRII